MSEQLKIFETEKSGKTYRAIRHDVVRSKQSKNSEETHHPIAKTSQAEKILKGKKGMQILELFAGQGNMTRIFAKHGDVLAAEKNKQTFEILNDKTKNNKSISTVRCDSYKFYHSLISMGKKFDIIDLDPYGFPSRLMPDIFLLIDRGWIFITMPKPAVNILNGITQTHLITYFGEPNPSKEKIIEKFATFGLCHWRKLVLVNHFELKSIYRFVFHIEKVKATDYTGVKNQ